MVILHLVMLRIVPEDKGQNLAEAFVEAAQRMEAIANFPYAVAAHRQPDALAGKHFAQVQHAAFPFELNFLTLYNILKIRIKLQKELVDFCSCT